MENTLAGVAGKKFILSYSCGKDSTLCLHKMLEAGAEPMALLVMFNPEAGRSYFHGVDPALLREYGISARLTFSNSLLREEHLSDRKCNALCVLFEEGGDQGNGVIVHSDLLLAYLKQQYPGFYFVSSTT